MDLGFAASFGGHDAVMSARSNLLTPIVAALAAAISVGCSGSETTGPVDPVEGTAVTELDDVGVEDGTEGGLELDDGNVPGSANDDDLDAYQD